MKKLTTLIVLIFLLTGCEFYVGTHGIDQVDSHRMLNMKQKQQLNNLRAE